MGYSSDIVTNLAIDWLKNRRDKSKPFFMMHHYKAPHDMFEYAPRYEYYLDDVEVPVPLSCSIQTNGAPKAQEARTIHFVTSSELLSQAVMKSAIM